jgi:hypothetical protein
MSERPDYVQTLHNEWANGQTSLATIRKLLNGRDLSQDVKRKAIAARFFTQSGLRGKAASILDEVQAIDCARLDSDCNAWVSNAISYFEYEVRRDFDKAAHYLHKSIEHGKASAQTPDIRLLLASSYWRLSAIELSRGSPPAFKRNQSIALGIARESNNPHEEGIILLSRGYGRLALGLPKRAYDDFLQALFRVGFQGIPIPHHLHAEIMLGLVISSGLIEGGKPRNLVDKAVALQRVHDVLARGTGRFVTPYPGYGTIEPKALADSLLMKDDGFQRHRKYVLKGILAAASEDDLDFCVNCKSRRELTVDHIIPRRWGGTDWVGNLRLLCRGCNSQRKHYFTYVDHDAYTRLALDNVHPTLPPPADWVLPSTARGTPLFGR